MLCVHKIYRKKYLNLFNPSQTIYRRKGTVYLLRSITMVLDAFTSLKSTLAEFPVLSLSQSHRPYLIDTDASAYSLEDVLLQEQNDINLKVWTTMIYQSWLLNKSKPN